MAIENYKEIEAALHLEEGTFSNAASSDDAVSIDLTKIKVFKQDDYSTLLSNHEKALDEKQTYSNQVGREESLKYFKEHLVKSGVIDDYDGRKDPDNLLKAVELSISKKSTSGDISEDVKKHLEKITALEAAVKTRDTDIETQKGLFSDLETTIKTKEDNSFIGKSLQTELAKYADKISVSIEDAATLYMSRRSLKKEGDSVTLYNDDSLIKNELGSALGLEDDVKEFIAPYFKQPSGGRGDGEGNDVNGKMSADKFHKAYMTANPTATASEANRALVEKIQKGEIL